MLAILAQVVPIVVVVLLSMIITRVATIALTLTGCPVSPPASRRDLP